MDKSTKPETKGKPISARDRLARASKRGVELSDAELTKVSGGDTPTESISLNFTKISPSYSK